MPTRHNPDLDAFMEGGEPVNQPPRGQRRRRKVAGSRDKIRRRAFRVLALLADLAADDRLAVLKAAERLNRA
jgi:hypothetical protein